MNFKEFKKDRECDFYNKIHLLHEKYIDNGYVVKTPIWLNLSIKNLPNEQWKKFDKYPEYEISNYGRVKSLPKIGNRYKLIILRQYFDSCGYLYATLNSKKEKLQILVLFAFEGKPPIENMEGHHENGIKWDNTLLNLKWLIPRDNQIHAYETGLKRKFFGKENVRAVPLIQYGLDGVFIKEWESIKMAERELGIDDAPIAKCCRGDINYKQAYGFIWRFKADVEAGDLPKEKIPSFAKPKFAKRRETTIRKKNKNRCLKKEKN